MQYSIQQFLLLGVFTLILVGALTPIMRSLAIRNGAVDSPNIPRKTHKEPVPYLGGVAIAIGILISSYGAMLYSDFSMRTFALASSVLIPALAISVMGLVDDLYGLEPWPRLVLQTIAGVIVAFILISTHTIGTPLNNAFLDSAVTIFWIVGVCNSINFFDNLDGGASGTVAVIAIFLFFIAYDRQQVLVSALAIVTAGATAGFLLWNKAPAKIYMGDAGSLFLGIIISVLTIRLNPDLAPRSKSLAIPLFLMALPILDTTVAVGSRIYRRISPFQGGRDHLSHRLIRVGLDRHFVAPTLWFAAAIFGSLALAIYHWPASYGYQLMIFGTLLWIFLLVYFLRIPSEDKADS
ncbi:MAG: MraY family glycosyltransferase [Candidatus Nanopelagicaceae bacterium]|nr:MraY family glycosyltransferase [Candidatus Nanopelagicaceae bacterium]